ncbi:hypothetical protein L0P88_13855 [Muricauda sp. SCSIO 64092]|uniref:hypothetical protein n=1 Tax=Allomuricauda sp. SCSIO 64092 TaxID=2908842 RepID=UPI001FF42C76|nr:hypothetical protein [Muricauda sp. SCSIO 64092]UOY05037.1 hypothetical protein L0P88_13855 [Muricauda sp. SCSIO 64092]
MKKLILSLVIIVSCYSCSNNLSRSNAKKQIIEKLDYPQDELLELTLEDRTIYRRITINRWKKYVELDLLTYTSFGQNKLKGRFPKVSIGGSGVRATLTEKGKQYLVSDAETSGFVKHAQVRQAELEFVEITGIQVFEKMNVATVSYNIRRTNITPFGNANNLKERVINQTANFIKYDDGWRIEY